MDTLKMKFKLNGLEFELEGKEETVKAEFENFKEFVSTKLLNRSDVITTNPSNITSSRLLGKIPNATDIDPEDDADIPILKEIVKKDLPKAEPDWILIYAFYATEFGEKRFTEADIKNKYEETGRKNDSRMRNLSNNLKSLLNKEYIKLHNDTEYMIKQSGLTYSRQIISGNSTSKTVKREKSKAANKTLDNKPESADKEKKKPSKHVKFVDLDLKSDQIESLTKFFKDKAPNTQKEEVAVVMKWYSNHAAKNDVSTEEINYLLSICSKVPSALEQVLINMKGSRFRWVSNLDNGGVKLTSIGESYVLTKLPKVNK